MSEVTRTPVKFLVVRPVKIDDDLILPAGRFDGIRKAIERPGRTHQITPVYLLELSPEQLKEVDAKSRNNLITAAYDVSKFIRSGEIMVLFR
jgi:hypothetical protein